MELYAAEEGVRVNTMVLEELVCQPTASIFGQSSVTYSAGGSNKAESVRFDELDSIDWGTEVSPYATTSIASRTKAKHSVEELEVKKNRIMVTVAEPLINVTRYSFYIDLVRVASLVLKFCSNLKEIILEKASQKSQVLLTTHHRKLIDNKIGESSISPYSSPV